MLLAAVVGGATGISVQGGKRKMKKMRENIVSHFNETGLHVMLDFTDYTYVAGAFTVLRMSE